MGKHFEREIPSIVMPADDVFREFDNNVANSKEQMIAYGAEIMLRGLGLDPTVEGLEHTPQRIAKMWLDIFSGLHQDPAKILDTTFVDENHQEMVIVRDIPFYSMCEHHFAPFFGRAHIGYIPDEGVVGISKLARLVDCFAKRPQIQERLTSQIADSLMEHTKAIGVGVVIEAEHMCMTMRGVRKSGAITTTSAVRGLLKEQSRARMEFLNLINGGK